MTHYGVALGRFQPIHLGHVEYLQAARDRCEHLVIGITNPNLSCLPECPEDPSRTKVASNPFTYFERARLIELTAAEYRWTSMPLSIVPADLDQLSFLTQCMPPLSETTIYTTIYDEWGIKKTSILRDAGFETEVLWRRTMESRFTSGTEIRKLSIDNNNAWNSKVPLSTIPTLNKLFQRLRTYHATN